MLLLLPELLPLDLRERIDEDGFCFIAHFRNSANARVLTSFKAASLSLLAPLTMQFNHVTVSGAV